MSELLKEMEKLFESGWIYKARKEEYHGGNGQSAGDVQTVTLRYKDKMKPMEIPQQEVAEVKSLFEKYNQTFPES